MIAVTIQINLFTIFTCHQEASHYIIGLKILNQLIAEMFQVVHFQLVLAFKFTKIYVLCRNLSV